MIGKRVLALLCGAGVSYSALIALAVFSSNVMVQYASISLIIVSFVIMPIFIDYLFEYSGRDTQDINKHRKKHKPESDLAEAVDSRSRHEKMLP